jgi:hypothetical protein
MLKENKRADGSERMKIHRNTACSAIPFCLCNTRDIA